MKYDNDSQLEKIHHSIETSPPKSIRTKEKYIIQQKILNHLIDVYQYKAKYYSPIAKNRPSMSSRSSLPVIKRNMPLNQLSIEGHIPIITPSSKKRENQKDKLNFLRLNLIQKARQKAKEQKDKMQIMNDNLRLYRDNLHLENINKRNVGITKRKLIEESIGNYKNLKKNYIELMNSDDIDKLNQINQKKKNELAYWKNKSESKLKKSASATTNLFVTQNIKNKSIGN